MAKSKQSKVEDVTKLTEKLSRAKSVVFTDYTGMTMSELSELRTKLREQGAEFSVTKNTLLKLALENNQETNSKMQTDDVLEGQTATLFSFQDEISPIKTVVTSFKSISERSSSASKIKVKGGFLGSEFLDQYKIISLSNLPSKLELQGKVVGVLVAPLHGLVGVMNANLRSVVYALEAIRKQKGGE